MQRRSRLARALLAGMLSRRAGTSCAEWAVVSMPSGKPYAVRRGADEALTAVSLSHSGGWVAAALSCDGSLGVDIEAHRHRPNYPGIATDAFGPAEIARTEQEGIAGFYRIWTLREALAKADGRGLVMAIDRVDRANTGPIVGSWTTQLESTNWNLTHSLPVPGLSLAVAWSAPRSDSDFAPIASQTTAAEFCRVRIIRNAPDVAALVPLQAPHAHGHQALDHRSLPV